MAQSRNSVTYNYEEEPAFTCPWVMLVSYAWFSLMSHSPDEDLLLLIRFYWSLNYLLFTINLLGQILVAYYLILYISILDYQVISKFFFWLACSFPLSKKSDRSTTPLVALMASSQNNTPFQNQNQDQNQNQNPGNPASCRHLVQSAPSFTPSQPIFFFLYIPVLRSLTNRMKKVLGWGNSLGIEATKLDK